MGAGCIRGWQDVGLMFTAVITADIAVVEHAVCVRGKAILAQRRDAALLLHRRACSAAASAGSPGPSNIYSFTPDCSTNNCMCVCVCVLHICMGKCTYPSQPSGVDVTANRRRVLQIFGFRRPLSPF